MSPRSVLATVLLFGPWVACTEHSRVRVQADAKQAPEEASPRSEQDTTGSRPHASAVLEHHDHPSRDGVYVDAKLTNGAVRSLHVDSAFSTASIEGPTYAQPLYLPGSAGKPDLVIVATETNHVYGFDATDGTKRWDRTLGAPVPLSHLPCGDIDPLGVTGTPAVDGVTRTIYLDAMTQRGGASRHQVFALDADTGEVRSGWPVDLDATVKAGAASFDSSVQNQRGALVLLGGSVFVPFGGHFGDCGSYHGWVVGISTADPRHVRAWATRAVAGGIWAPGGIASDGASLLFATGNTESTPDRFHAPESWQDGNAVFRLPPSLEFSGRSADYFVPGDWQSLDDRDLDLGGSNPVVFEDPGAKPERLVMALGKNGQAYLLDRDNLGGMGAPLASATVSQSAIINAPAAYTTSNGTFVVFKGRGRGCPGGQQGGLTAIRVSRADPPALSVAWCGGPTTTGSPAVSMTDRAGANALVWIVGADDMLRALDGNTGQAVSDGGGTSMSSVQKFQTPIVADGRVFVATEDHLYAFTP